MNDRAREALLPGALGFADGILNALTLTSAKLLNGGSGVSAGLAVRVAIAALVTAGFAMAVGEYTSARGTLRHSAQQLTMGSEVELLGTKLGRAAIRHSFEQSMIASATSCAGALLPLLLASLLPGPHWIAAVVAIAALGGLGVGLATISLGSRLIWAAVLVAGGVLVTLVGLWIHIA